MSAATVPTDGKIHGQRIPGTNGWRAAVNYQGTVVTCDHRHASALSARQCLDVATKAKALRDADRAAQAALSLTADEDLLRTFARLTHQIHEASWTETRADLRAQRDLVQAEVLRRMSRTA